MASRDRGTIFISLQLGTAEFQAGIASVEKQFNKLSQSAYKLGAQMSLAFSLPLGILARSAVKSFGDFDQAMANSLAVMKLTGNVSQEMTQALTQGAINVSKTTEHSAAEAASAYYDLASAGLDAAHSLQALPVVADLATAGQMKMADATRTLIGVQKAFALTSNDAEENFKNLQHVGDAIAVGSKLSLTHVDELSKALTSQAAGIMRTNKTSLEEAIGLYSVLANQLKFGTTAGTTLGIVMSELGIKAIKHAEAFKALKINVYDANGQFGGMINILKQLEVRFKNFSPEDKLKGLLNLGFGSRNVKFIQQLMGFADEAAAVSERVKHTDGDLHALASHMREGFNMQMQIAKNRLTDVGIAIGQDLAPYVLGLTKILGILAEQFLKLPAPLRAIVEIAALLLGVVGPLAYVFATLTGAISASASIFGSLVKWLFVAETATTAAGAAAGAAGVEAGAAAVGVTAFQLSWLLIPAAVIAAGVAIYAYWDNITAAASKFVSWFATTFPVVAKEIAFTWGVLKLFVEWAVDNFPNILTAGNEVWNGLVDGATNAISAIVGMFQTLFGMFDETIKKFSILSKVGDAIQHPAETLAKGITGLLTPTDPDAEKKKAEAQGFADTIKKWASAYYEAQKASAAHNAEASKTPGVFEQISNVLKGDFGPSLEEIIGSSDEKGLKGVAKNAKSAAKAMETLQEKLTKAQSKSDQQDISAQIKDAINSGDNAGFETLKDKFRTSVEEGVLAGLKSDVTQAGNTAAAKKMAEDIASATADKEVEKLYTEKAKADAKLSAERMKQYEQESKAWAELFRNAFTAQKQNFAAIFKDIAASFVGSIVAGLSGVGPEKLSPAGLGEAAGAYAMKGLDWLLGSNSSNPQGFYGPGGDPKGTGAGQESNPALKNGIASGIIIATQTFGAAKGAHKLDQQTQSNQGTGAAIGTGAGGTIGAVFGGPAGAALGAQLGNMLGGAIGKMFKWGPQNPETKARHAFANFIEDGFKKLSTVAFFDAKGKLKTMSSKNLNFLEGPSNKFNQPGWADKINSLGSAARNTFLGLGEAMKDVLKLTDGVGSQIGAMLAENLGGNIDNARLLVQQLGLSLQDMVDALVNVGLTGKETWLEVETQIQGVTQAFQPGLVALGDIRGAFDELSGSAGRGVAALKSIKDIAQEGIDLGAKSLEDLKNLALKQGVDPKFIDDYIKALQDHGIKKLEDLAAASNQTLGSIVAEMNAVNKPLADTWAKMGVDIDTLSAKLKDLPTQIESNITLNVTANVSDEAQAVLDSPVGAQFDLPTNTKKFAKGGLINRQISFGLGGGATGIAGEMGSEFIMPATRLPDGSMGIRALSGGGGGGGFHITVNAQGAAPGVEHRVVDAIKQMQSNIIAQTIDVIDRRRSRGGRNG